MTMTSRSDSTPSISASSWGTIVDSMSELMPRTPGTKQRVHLVEEDNDGHALFGLFSRALKDHTDLALGLSDVFIEQLGAFDVQEVRTHVAVSGEFGDLLRSEFATAFAIKVLPQPGGP